MGRKYEKHGELSSVHILEKDLDYYRARKFKSSEPFWRVHSRILGEYRTGNLEQISKSRDILQMELLDARAQMDILEKELESLELDRESIIESNLEKYI